MTRREGIRPLLHRRWARNDASPDRWLPALRVIRAGNVHESRDLTHWPLPWDAAASIAIDAARALQRERERNPRR